jgi:ADP-ribosylglycohydrolase
MGTLIQKNAADMVRASLAADALALGVHWIYSTEEIRKIKDPIDSLMEPKPDSYHPTKKRGDFTHYGDQILVLLDSLSRSRSFDPDDFFKAWQMMFSSYSGYVDSATKNTLSRIAQGKTWEDCGSLSNDIAGAARSVPIVAWLHKNSRSMVSAVEIQTRMTHQDSDTIDTAAFFARVSLACLYGQAPVPAMIETAEKEFENTPVDLWVAQGLKASDRESLEAVKGFGQSCHTPEAFSGVVQLIARYEDNLSQAVIQAVMAGGDNAARASLVAQVLAAYQGLDPLTSKWFDDLAEADRINRLLATMP